MFIMMFNQAIMLSPGPDSKARGQELADYVRVRDIKGRSRKGKRTTLGFRKLKPSQNLVGIKQNSRGAATVCCQKQLIIFIRKDRA